jgi:hypothetical protein
MPNHITNPNLPARLQSFQNNVAGVQSSMRRFNRLINGQSERNSSSRMLRGYGGGRNRNGMLEQISHPLLSKLFSGILGDLTGNARGSGQLGDILAGGITGGSSRSSQGQIWADIASAITRAGRRNL